MNLIYESLAYFRFQDYHINHSQLLIRGDRVLEGDIVDIAFEGTYCLNCPIQFEGLKLYVLDEEETDVHGLATRPYSSNFLIETNNKNYFIQAVTLRIFINNLLPFESCIMTGKGQEKLIYMSK